MRGGYWQHGPSPENKAAGRQGPGVLDVWDMGVAEWDMGHGRGRMGHGTWDMGVAKWDMGHGTWAWSNLPLLQAMGR